MTLCGGDGGGLSDAKPHNVLVVDFPFLPEGLVKMYLEQPWIAHGDTVLPLSRYVFA